MVIRTVSSQIPQSKYLYQHCSFQWFTKILQIAKRATKRKCTVLSIEDKIAICKCLDKLKGSSKREITHEYAYDIGKSTVSELFL